MRTLEELLEEKECVAYAIIEADGETLVELQKELEEIEMEIDQLTLPIGEQNEPAKISN